MRKRNEALVKVQRRDNVLSTSESFVRWEGGWNEMEPTSLSCIKEKTEDGTAMCPKFPSAGGVRTSKTCDRSSQQGQFPQAHTF